MKTKFTSNLVKKYTGSALYIFRLWSGMINEDFIFGQFLYRESCMACTLHIEQGGYNITHGILMKETREKWLDAELTVYCKLINTSLNLVNIGLINPLKTSPEYTRAGVYGKCVL